MLRLGIQSASFMRNPKIKRAIALLQSDAVERTGVDIAWWVEQCKQVYERCSQVTPVMVENATGAWAESGEFRFNSAGAVRALDMIGRHIGAYTLPQERG